MRAPRWWPTRGLWRHPAFLRLWAAQIVSAIGSRITRTALPVIAVASLAATPGDVSLMMAMVFVPGLALALVAGGIVDRGDKRALLVGADLVRAVAVASIPIAAWAGVLGLAHLIAVAGVVGAASALFQITDNAYLPALVGKDQLAEGNAKIEATESVAEIVGPAAAGVLIRALGAPLAVLLDALSYVWSAAFLVRLPPARGTATGPRPRKRDDLAAGARAVWHAPAVRRVVVAGIVEHLAGGFFIALYMVFALRELALGEALVGVIIGMGGVGALLGAVAAPRLGNALGVDRTLVVAMVVSRLAAFFIPLADGAAAIPLLIAHQLVGDGFMVVFAVHAMTVRQTALPGEILGRANAAIHVGTGAATLLGILAGGIAGDALDARAGLWIAAGLGMVAPLFVITYQRPTR